MSSSPSSRGGAAGASNAGAGIELALVSGTSPTVRVVFTATVPPTRAMIGSGQAADWCVTARGVDAQHAEIAWDGATLWVRNAGSPRGTYVGIERVDEWRELEPGSEVGIGDARLVASVAGGSGESIAPAAEAIDPSDPSVPAHIAVAAMRGAYDPTRMAASIDVDPRAAPAGPSGSSRSIPPPPPPRAPGPPPRSAGPGPQGHNSLAAGSRAPGPPLRAPGPPPRAGALPLSESSVSVTTPRAPMVNAPVATPAAPPVDSRKPAPRQTQSTGPRPLPRAPSTADNAATQAVEERPGDSTVITSHPPYTTSPDTSTATNPHVAEAIAAAQAAALLRAAAAPVPPARMGGGHAADDDDLSDFNSDEATVAISNSSDGSLSVGGIGAPASMPAPFGQQASPSGSNPFAQALSPANAAPSPFGRAQTLTGVPANSRPSNPGNLAFGHIPSAHEQSGNTGRAMGPNGAPASSLSGVFGAIPPPDASARANASTPIFATLPRRTQIMLAVTAAAALVLLGILLGRGGNSDTNAAPRDTVVVNDPAPTGPPPTPPLEGPAAGQTGTLFGATIAPPMPPIDPRHPPPPGVPLSAVPERIAADAVIQGRLREAISLYQALAIAHVETPVYNQIATILRRKVEAQQQPCAPGSATPCGPNAAQPSSR